MAIGSPGADSSNLVTRLVNGKPMVDVAAELLGQMPVLWGRYFTSVATSGLVEYRARRENQALRDRNIRVLPIARQTKHVDGTQADGSADAQLNAEDLIKTFGASYLQSQGGRFLMFLDVEGTPSLSVDYYLGWARTLVDHSRSVSNGAVTIVPGVYAARRRYDLASRSRGGSARRANPGRLGGALAHTRLRPAARVGPAYCAAKSEAPVRSSSLAICRRVSWW